MERMSRRPNSNGYPDTCVHAGLVYDTLNIAQHWLITGIEDGDQGFEFRLPPIRHVEFR